MRILHISAECYPAAKVGGLGDVVGALPKYLNRAGLSTAVIIPKYKTAWINNHRFVPLYRSLLRLRHQHLVFSIEQLIDYDLGFPLIVVDIPGKFDRPGIYADAATEIPYADEVERNICFQQAVLHWIMQLPQAPEILHCHDHHTALIPFLIRHAHRFRSLRALPTVFTIHNGAYQGAFSWGREYLLPAFEDGARGLLDWQASINPMATAIKCCWQLTTVSPAYLQELQHKGHGLGPLLRAEADKSLGILNGIDTKVWDPAEDPLIHQRLNGDLGRYKAANKAALCEHFAIDPELPIVTFIGRLAGEKGADLIPELVGRYLHGHRQATFLVLGSGQPALQDRLRKMRPYFAPYFDAAIEYNERLAHQLYAGSDFLLMPSRVEPCGLNQLYALRYGTVPIVRSTGGLKDSIIDISEPEGRGIRFERFDAKEALVAIHRAVELFHDKERFERLRADIIRVDFSWEKSTATYIKIYQQLLRATG
ncbi:MAG: glycogen/starch synthase [Bacteroidota bacterium]